MNKQTSRAQSNASGRLPDTGDYVRPCGLVVAVEDYTPPPVAPVRHYVVLVRSARVECRVNGHLLKEFGTFNEFYGQWTSVREAIREANQQNKRFDGAATEFVVVMVEQNIRFRATHSSDSNLYHPEFRRLDEVRDQPAEDPTETEVWSSQRGFLVEPNPVWASRWVGPNADSDAGNNGGAD